MGGDYKFVPVRDLKYLKEGDIIRGRGTGRRYQVTGNYGSHVTAVETMDVTNPIEWEVLRRLGQSATPKDGAATTPPPPPFSLNDMVRVLPHGWQNAGDSGTVIGASICDESNEWFYNVRLKRQLSNGEFYLTDFGYYESELEGVEPPEKQYKKK